MIAARRGQEQKEEQAIIEASPLHSWILEPAWRDLYVFLTCRVAVTQLGRDPELGLD